MYRVLLVYLYIQCIVSVLDATSIHGLLPHLHPVVRRVTNQKAAILSETQALWEGKLPWTLGQTKVQTALQHWQHLRSSTPTLLEIPLEILEDNSN